ncbi:MAG: rRNA maturation RNase YbeY [Clostridia bacterium]|nr:rRNA maturation RNase YbeY [Clostridia bacterium]
MKILITNRQKRLEFTAEYRALIKKAVRYVIEHSKMSGDYEISVTITDNGKIKEINREFRDIDKETDVLSFPMLEFSEPEVPFEEEEAEADMPLGDIVISLEKAASQAAEYGHGTEREIAYLTVHSMLHLLGYDHMEDEDRLKMRAREKQIMKGLGLEEAYDK